MSTRVTCPDPSSLVSYLYGEFEPGETPTRVEVSRHLAQCARCADELAALGGVREQLSAWTTPEADLGFQIVQSPSRQTSRQSGRRFAWLPSWEPSGLWGGVPMAAAAVLVMGAALGLARLDVQYDASGLRVRTGWGHGDAQAAVTPTGAPAAAAQTVAKGSVGAATPVTVSDLAAFEARFRQELASTVAATTTPAADEPVAQNVSQNVTLTPAAEAALFRRLRALVDESEIRQQQNLQLRVTEIAREFQGQRQADLVQIQQGFGRLTSDNAQQRQLIREYFRNVSTAGTRPPQ